MPDSTPETAMSTAAPTVATKAGIWPTFWAFVPYHEASIALKEAGTTGFAVYVSVCIQRFLTPQKFRSAFFCSEENLKHLCGISERRIREPLRQLEAAKLIKIERPQGIEKWRHQANKITLLPVFVNGNEIKARPDKASGPKRTKRPVATGHEVGTNLSGITELPLKGVTHAAVSDSASVDASSTADELRTREPTYRTLRSFTDELMNDGQTKAEADASIKELRADGSLIKTDDGRFYLKSD